MPVPNPCDECSVCCDLLGIPEIAKPVGERCPHCPTGSGGCNIYDTRPSECRKFRCGYHLSPVPVPIEYRPDHCHVMVTGADKKLRLHFVHVDPAFPDALDTPIGRHLVAIIRLSDSPDILVTIGDRMVPMFTNPVRGAVVMHELENRDETMRRK